MKLQVLVNCKPEDSVPEVDATLGCLLLLGMNVLLGIALFCGGIGIGLFLAR